MPPPKDRGDEFYYLKLYLSLYGVCPNTSKEELEASLSYFEEHKETLLSMSNLLPVPETIEWARCWIVSQGDPLAYAVWKAEKTLQNG